MVLYIWCVRMGNFHIYPRFLHTDVVTNLEWTQTIQIPYMTFWIALNFLASVDQGYLSGAWSICGYRKCPVDQPERLPKIWNILIGNFCQWELQPIPLSVICIEISQGRRQIAKQIERDAMCTLHSKGTGILLSTVVKSWMKFIRVCLLHLESEILHFSHIFPCCPTLHTDKIQNLWNSMTRV